MGNKFVCPLICEYEACKLILESPVTLPCGKTVCLEHLSQFENSLNCFICHNEHAIPQMGFQVNSIMMSMIKSLSHLDEPQKIVKLILNELEEEINEYMTNVENDPENFIYDYFSKIRNQIDLHREKIFRKLNDKSNEFIEKLNDLEKELRKNASNKQKFMIKTSYLKEINEMFIRKMNGLLRKHDLNGDELKQYIEQILSKYNHFKSLSVIKKNDLLMQKSIIFLSKNSEEFGDLIITHGRHLSNNIGDLLHSFRDDRLDSIRDFLLADDARNVIIGVTSNGSIAKWNLNEDDDKKNLKIVQNAHSGNCINCILWIKDNIFATGSFDYKIKLWNLDSLECVDTFENQRCSIPYSMCLLSENELACGLSNGNINIWNLNPDFCIRLFKVKTFKAHDNQINCLKLSIDRKTLVSCSKDSIIKIWNNEIDYITLIKVIKGHLDSVLYFELISNDQQIMSCSHDKTIRLFDSMSGACIEKYELKSAINCFKKINQNLIAIGLNDAIESNLIIYDLSEKKVVKEFIGHENGVFKILLRTYLNYSNKFRNNDDEEDQLLSCSKDGSIKLWKL